MNRVRQKLSAVTGQSERTVLLAMVLLASSVSVATGFLLANYFAVDVVPSLIVFVPGDCYFDWPTKVGRHCFSDYSITVSIGMTSNPWDPYPLFLPPDYKPTHFNYTAAGMVPHVLFGYIGKLLGAPLAGLFGYLLALTAAVLTPAFWAARGAQGVERIVVFVACGVAAVPAWVAIDRGNSVGFIVPVALCFLLALSRQRWGLVAIMVVLAALVKPQFAVLAFALFAARQWRMGGIAVIGVAASNIAAYALWPRDFPGTILQSVHNTAGYGPSAAVVANSNVSFSKGLLAIPDGLKAAATGGVIPSDYLAGPRSLIGYVILLLVIVVVLVLGLRIRPLMTGIVLLATACLFPTLSNPYYLVFVLPIAALVVRDPNGPPGTGIFDRPETVGGRRRAVGVCVSVATALCIAQIAVPGPPQQLSQVGTDAKSLVVTTTLYLAPILWLVALAAILLSYARRPASNEGAEEGADQAEIDDKPDGGDAAVSSPTEQIAEFSPQSQS